MKKPMAIVIAAALVLGVVATGLALQDRGGQQSAEARTVQEASSPTSTTEGVVPYVLRTESGGVFGPGGNVACEDLGAFAYTSARTNYEPGDPNPFTIELTDGAGAVGTVTVTYATDTKTLDFQSTIPIEVAIVKGGNEANIYDYRTGSTSADTGLGAPPNPGGSADLSNLTLCSNPLANPVSNWCSPGYWRNHPEAWVATGIDPTTALYTSYFDANTLSGKAPAGANPTLAEVLKSPQTFGGPAFNNVGDLLSEAHPDVTWTWGDDRSEDSCPLS